MRKHYHSALLSDRFRGEQSIQLYFCISTFISLWGHRYHCINLYITLRSKIHWKLVAGAYPSETERFKYREKHVFQWQTQSLPFLKFESLPAAHCLMSQLLISSRAETRGVLCYGYVYIYVIPPTQSRIYPSRKLRESQKGKGNKRFAPWWKMMTLWWALVLCGRSFSSLSLGKLIQNGWCFPLN